ncbi:MurR/RpiR family transcriptional regulator [Spiroplasma chinense]|uniref:MurR/RpiR family transcriptional regulator n=2 Tax=Spiroplasma chinense TaxID=216932 RepID=A0A5B9Y6Y4_9MOLU|nr:MurR/RpiR family transcriptional regulator [Spiroplasma chinense]QEH61852.1 MurR/RpiR family transcriptional regulator [Spiroplasma chinense]
MTKTEQYLYKRILEDKLTFSRYTLKEISENYFVSETVVLRLMNKLNFSSLKEMQAKLYSDYEMESLTNIEDNHLIDDVEEVINNTFAKSLYGLIMTRKKNNVDTFKTIREIFMTRKSIIFFGIGNSHSVAKMLSDSLRKIGFNSYIFGSTKEVLIFIEFCDPKDTIFVFYTNSGKTHEVVFLAKNVIKMNGEFILVTNENSDYHSNELSKARCVFEYAVSSKEHYAFPIVSAQFCQAIFNNIILNLLISSSDDFMNKLDEATKNLNSWNEKN